MWTVQRDRFPWWHAATVRKLPISGPIALMKGITNLAISFICSVISSQHYWVLVTTYIIKSRGEDAGVSVWGNWALLTLTLTVLFCESSIADFWVAFLSYHKTPDKKAENVSREPRCPLHEKKNYTLVWIRGQVKSTDESGSQIHAGMVAIAMEKQLG